MKRYIDDTVLYMNYCYVISKETLKYKDFRPNEYDLCVGMLLPKDFRSNDHDLRIEMYSPIYDDW